MSGHGFKSLFMAASVAGAALGCYLVSLNVASERAKLEAVEERIVLAQRDIRVLQTEIGTRGRLAQLERWNVKFIHLSAPTADQFVEGGFQLASMVAPKRKPSLEAPVILAAAPAEQARPMLTDDAVDAPPPSVAKSAEPKEMLHTASYSKPEQRGDGKPKTAAPAASAKPSASKPAMTKTAKNAAADPLAPLPTAKSPAKAGASKKSPVAAKDDGTAQ